MRSLTTSLALKEKQKQKKNTETRPQGINRNQKIIRKKNETDD